MRTLHWYDGENHGVFDDEPNPTPERKSTDDGEKKTREAIRTRGMVQGIQQRLLLIIPRPQPCTERYLQRPPGHTTNVDISGGPWTSSADALETTRYINTFREAEIVRHFFVPD